MNIPAQLQYEAAGVVFLIGAGIVTVIVTTMLSPLIPSISATWVFLVLIAVLWGTMGLREQPDRTAGEHATVDERATDGGEDADGGVVGVDLLNWANERVGKECLGCEEEITYIPLGTTDGQRSHRIECGCTVINSTTTD